MRRAIILFSAVFLVFISLPIFAQTITQMMPSPPQDTLSAISMLEPIMTAVKGGNWAMVASLVILLMVYVAKKYLMKSDGSQDQWLPLMSAGLGVMVSVASNLYMGQQGVLESVLAGIFVGNAASGFWDTFIKSVPRKLLKKD